MEDDKGVEGEIRKLWSPPRRDESDDPVECMRRMDPTDMFVGVDAPPADAAPPPVVAAPVANGGDDLEAAAAAALYAGGNPDLGRGI